MLKGHVCIDLHNVNSGFTERIEKDNTVTNALKIAYPLYDRANIRDRFFPIWKKALGGLLIFSNKLNDSPSNVAIPSDNEIIGMAGDKVTTSSGAMGSLNTGESGTKGDPNSYTTVWDFTTTQANGKISALARTHLDMGNGNMQTNSYREFCDTENAYAPFAYDKATDELFFIKFTNDSVKFYYQRIDLFKRRILTDTGNWVPSNVDHNFLTISFNDAGLVNDRLDVYVDDDYLCIRSGRPDYYENDYNNYGLHVTKFNIPDLMKKPSSISGVTIKKVFTADNCPKPTDMNASRLTLSATMYEGKIYVKYYKDSRYHYASYSLDSGSLLDTDPLGISTSDDSWYVYTHNSLLVNKDKWTIKPLSVNGPLNTNSSSLNWEYCLYDYDNNLLTGIYSNYGLGSFPTEYLGTIFNLDEPVTKTESTTMKITYTLSNA